MFEEQKSVCTRCGHIHKLTAHHKIRRRDGGPNAAWNLVGVCRPCHDQIHGTGRGCEVDCGYPNWIAAAEASAAHWEVVREYWEHTAMLDLYDRREATRRLQRGGTAFGTLLAEALEQLEPRCT